VEAGAGLRIAGSEAEVAKADAKVVSAGEIRGDRLGRIGFKIRRA
jgi:hypothetical protein